MWHRNGQAVPLEIRRLTTGEGFIAQSLHILILQPHFGEMYMQLEELHSQLSAQNSYIDQVQGRP